jgi:MFS transporter, MFS domain-containing protein family, molybdate-anion transporter
VGTFADRYGRKRACQVYCGLYAASALTTLFSSTRILLLGRALAGVSSAMLSRVFEMWMLGEFRRLEFGESEGAEKYMYCTMTTVNGFVSVAAGIVSQVLVQSFKSEVAPFLGSIVCLGLAYLVIDKTWVC